MKKMVKCEQCEKNVLKVYSKFEFQGELWIFEDFPKCSECIEIWKQRIIAREEALKIHKFKKICSLTNKKCVNLHGKHPDCINCYIHVNIVQNGI